MRFTFINLLQAINQRNYFPHIFFTLIIFYEIVSLHIGSWWWPGNYMYTIVLGCKIFPVDDILIWYLLSTPALIGGYEFSVDDGK
jgi:hypothetical protein